MKITSDAGALFNSTADWQLLTPQNLMLRNVYGWGYSIQKFVNEGEPKPCITKNLFIASDYSGNHQRFSHVVYCYLVLNDSNQNWIERLKNFRLNNLADKRRISYKKLGDPVKQKAIVKFLEMASDFDGHLVAIAVDKRKKWLSTYDGFLEKNEKLLGIRTKWNKLALESMLRKVHFASLLSAIWAKKYGNITWVTDEDEFVANENRHDDVLKLLGRYISLYNNKPMGVLRMNTTAQDIEGMYFEDLVAIPDLAAGMIAEISSSLSKNTWAGGRIKEVLTPNDKSSLLADWFWDKRMRLRKTLVLMENIDDKFSVRKVWMENT